MPDTIKPVFLLSLVRSGSTLLQRVLAGHSKISTTGEPWILLPYLFAHKKQGTMTAYAHATSYTGVADFIENLLGAIVGIEIPLARLIGKWKMSQNRPAADHPGIVAGLREAGSDDAMTVGKVVAERNQR